MFLQCMGPGLGLGVWSFGCAAHMEGAEVLHYEISERLLRGFPLSVNLARDIVFIWIRMRRVLLMHPSWTVNPTSSKNPKP